MCYNFLELLQLTRLVVQPSGELCTCYLVIHAYCYPYFTTPDSVGAERGFVRGGVTVIHR
jgi:hypothetical protein